MQSLLRVHIINIITWSTEPVQSIKFKTSACIIVSSEQRTNTASTDTLSYTHPPLEEPTMCRSLRRIPGCARKPTNFRGTLQVLYYLAQAFKASLYIPHADSVRFPSSLTS